MADPEEGVTLPARTIPWPASISPEARAMLRTLAAQPDRELAAAPDDFAEWERQIAAVDVGMAAMQEARLDPATAIESRELAGVAVHVARPAGQDRADRRLYLEIHGGGLIAGGGRFARACAGITTALHGVETVSVDYRMPPRHPYPAALDDCLAVYRACLAERGPGEIVVGGASAGGNLAAALMLRAREEGLPMPAGLVLLTPEVDLTESGDSFETLLGLDPMLRRRLGASILLYANGAALDDPLLSPLFGDLAGFPPTLLQTGTRDLFLSNTVRMHRALRRAGVAAELHVFEAMPHGGFFGTPEDAERDTEIARFVAQRWRI